MISSTTNSLASFRALVLLRRYSSRAKQYGKKTFSSSSPDTDTTVNYASKHKGPIVNQLWTARLKAKEKAANEFIDMDRPRSPSESVTKFTYDFKKDKFLAERYKNPFGHLRFGKARSFPCCSPLLLQSVFYLINKRF